MSNVFRPVVSFAPFVSFAGAFVSLSLCLSLASEASAQTTDAIGVRAQGLAGAFTAVADDATAKYWKTGGLAGGALFDGLLVYARTDRRSGEAMSGLGA